MKRRERKKEREKTPLIVDTKFRDSARKPLGPISAYANWGPCSLSNPPASTQVERQPQTSGKWVGKNYYFFIYNQKMLTHKQQKYDIIYNNTLKNLKVYLHLPFYFIILQPKIWQNQQSI